MGDSMCLCAHTCVIQIGAVLDVNKGFKQVCRESSLSLTYTNYITVSTLEMKANKISHD